jgi:hypothetical protein
MHVEIGNKDTGLVKPVQEWLCYNGISVQVDDDFGGATLEGVEQFQLKKCPPATGIVDDKTWTLMNYPIYFLDHYDKTPGEPLLDAIVKNAYRHYTVKPVELGGDNRGPFVRYYMKGQEGPKLAWCCGSMSTIVLQSFDMVGISPVGRFNYQMGCDAAYADAKKYKTLVKTPVPGCIFLVYDPKNPADCIHTGIVVKVDLTKGIIYTFEGNTNDGGSSNGFEYIPRIRGISNKYYIKLA